MSILSINSNQNTGQSADKRTNKSIRLALTPGEPAGIGPDLVIRLAQMAFSVFAEASARTTVQIVVFADSQLLQERAQLLGLPLEITLFDETTELRASRATEIFVKHIEMPQPCIAGELNVGNAHYVLQTLAAAIDACSSGQFDAMVTAPVHKGIINEAGVSFSGHTEFLAERTNTDKVVMMLATEGLRVALATTHLPLKDVASHIGIDSLTETITILQRDLQQVFGIKQPRILVCGLNPHAGEGGHMGREEIDTIIPCLERLREQGINLIGPLPADTLFTAHHLNNADAVLAMYHDQGLPVLKYKGFGKAVNITLGLPIIRTSVDHGTALDLAATHKVDTGSLETALGYAVHMSMAKNTTIAKGQGLS